MDHYMVFAADRRHLPGNASAGPPPAAQYGLVWDNYPVGVFKAPDAESACQAAARKEGRSGTFFAVAGVAWGLSLNPVDGVTELGDDLTQPPNRQLAAGDDWHEPELDD